jgi:hypothetical protein
LLQDFLAVGDQQQRRRLRRGEVRGEVGMQTRHIKGGEHGFAGAGGGHHTIAEAVVEGALGREGVEHLALVGVGPQVEPHRRAAVGGCVILPGAGEVVPWRMSSCVTPST